MSALFYWGLACSNCCSIICQFNNMENQNQKSDQMWTECHFSMHSNYLNRTLFCVWMRLEYFFLMEWILQKGRMPTYSRKNQRINSIPIIIDLKLKGCPLLSAMFFTFSKSSLPACHNNNNDFNHLEHFVELKNYLVFNNALNVWLLATFYMTEFKSHVINIKLTENFIVAI